MVLLNRPARSINNPSTKTRQNQTAPLDWHVGNRCTTGVCLASVDPSSGTSPPAAASCMEPRALLLTDRDLSSRWKGPLFVLTRQNKTFRCWFWFNHCQNSHKREDLKLIVFHYPESKKSKTNVLMVVLVKTPLQ